MWKLRPSDGWGGGGEMLLEDAGQAGFGKGFEGKVDDGERRSVGITWIAAYGRLLLPDGGNRGCCRCFFARSILAARVG